MGKTLAVAFALAGLGLPLQIPARAGGDKPMKGDVVVRKTGDVEVKSGQLVEIQVGNPNRPPYAEGFKVLVDGKSVSAEIHDTKPVDEKGKELLGGDVKSVFLKFEEKGQKNVRVEFTRGGKPESREYRVTIK